MIKEIQYVSIKEALRRTLSHPLLQDVNLGDAIQYVIDFIGSFGLPKMYIDKEADIEIKDYRGLLPCDLVAINQVMDKKDNMCLASMTDTFTPKKDGKVPQFKTQGRVIMTTKKEQNLVISYRAIPVDDDGYPLLPDNAIFLRCLNAFIKKEYFSYYFDEGKINVNVMEKAERDYYALANQLNSEFSIPSISEMESLKNLSLIHI